MATVLDLTSFDQIRGVLAVSPKDLPDEVLTPFALEDDLAEDLESWLEDWETVRDSADGAKSRTLRLYAKYRCASFVAVSGQNFMFTQMTDGASAGQRSDREGFQTLRENLESRAVRYREKLETLLEPDAPPEEFRTLMGASKPNRDPVTTGRGNVS